MFTAAVGNITTPNFGTDVDPFLGGQVNKQKTSNIIFMLPSGYKDPSLTTVS